jgi:hypothetical protein
MKLLLITTAIIGALGAGLASAETKDVLDCEIKLVPGTNYYNRSDANCAFDVIGGGTAVKIVLPVAPPVDDDDDEEPVDEPPVDEPPVDEPPVEDPTPVDPPADPEPTPEEPAPVDEH